MPKPILRNTLFYGDNLAILRQYINDESVDLIYLDPPFNSARTYNVLFKEQTGMESPAQVEAFIDTWNWDTTAQTTYDALRLSAGAKIATLIQTLYTLLGTSPMMAYLVMMTARLIELHRILKPTGSLYLHCDPTASHYLKIILDVLFGAQNFRNEIVWKRTTAHNDPQRYGRIQDRLLFYSKTETKTFNRLTGLYSEEQLSRYKYRDNQGPFRAENLTAPHFSPTRTVEWRGTHPGKNRQWRFSIEELERLYAAGRILLQRDGRPRKDGYKVYLHEAEGPPLQDIWTDIALAPTAGERLGYPTQKPLALLERIIQASSNEGDYILDPFSGCGTAITAAQRLNRQWIGIDITHLAIALHKSRLKAAYGLNAKTDYDVVGEPEDLPSAQQLAEDDRYQFQFWALSLIAATPYGAAVGSKTGKKGSDKGIDGELTFIDLDEQRRETIKRVIVQVKSGNVKSGDVRDLRGVIDREGAAIGVFISLKPVTREMRTEAVSLGSYESRLYQKSYPRMQLLTIADLLATPPAQVQMPPTKQAGYKLAQREQRERVEQGALLLIEPTESEATEEGD